MASSSSPTSPRSSTASSSSSFEFPRLPIMNMREKIVEKILENRVTLIIGETGCGKSSQVPQFLLQKNIKPILCTQPRRFAVVAVAKMVAKARKWELGGDVGYHIGHSKHLCSSSKIIFKTAGVLLDEMRDKGMHALDYKVIILDEVHERSVESDLVLVFVKQFLLKNNKLRVVLMSATADIARYRDYFRDIGRDEKVEVIAIPSADQQTVYQRRVFYLEQVTKLLGVSTESISEKYCSGESPLSADANVKPEVHKLIFDLVLQIDDDEEDKEKSILIFLPTYRSLEQQWRLLKPLSSKFKVHVLHSSIDIEQALMAMKIWKSHRKIILATNIAESSVTIPKVAFVIDSCRSLQVFWDSNRRTESSELVWISKAQAEQRRGRTGRTCDGQVYRLVPGAFFNELEDYECPTILKLSLRQQVLLICCAESKAINDPKVLMQKALDPPNPDVIEDALDLLVHMGALQKTSHRMRYEPTFYGLLLASFSLSFDASVLILKFGDAGMLHEGILLGLLMDTQPLPIVNPFGEEVLFRKYLDCYFSGDMDNSKSIGQKEMVLIGNLCAFKFWQRIFKDKSRIENLKQVLKFDETKQLNEVLLKIEEEWCFFHNLLQSSLHHVAELYEDVLCSLHRFRPKFLGAYDGFPSYYVPYEFEHTCLLQSQSHNETSAVDNDELHDPSTDIWKCVSVPFVTTNQFQTKQVIDTLVTCVKEIRSHYARVPQGGLHHNVTDSNVGYVKEAASCIYFMKGSCNRGNSCPFSHSSQGKQPTCNFFFSLQGCRNGESCSFSHDPSPLPVSLNEHKTCLPEDSDADPASLVHLFPSSPDNRILIFDDMGFHFTSNIAHHIDPSKIVTTTCLSETSVYEASLTGIKIFWGLHHPYQTIICNSGENPIPWKEVRCILWFPNFEDYDRNLEGQRITMQKFFQYLAIRILADGLFDVRVVVTMNNIRYSQLKVEQLGRTGFFFLSQSFPFDEESFGKLLDRVSTKKPMLPSTSICYVFDLHPPTDIQFGDYAAEMHKCLQDVQ